MMALPAAFGAFRFAGTGFIACLLLAACGSDKESATEAEQTNGTNTAASASTNAAAGAGNAATGSDGLGAWVEFEAPVPPAPAYPFNHAFAVPPPASAADADAVIARYTKECPAGASSATCRDLRLEVEGVFLEALVAVRGTDEEVDPKWYRQAAVAQTPQLACIALRELIFLPGRTAEDEALLVRALDSPVPEVRNAVLAQANKVPTLADLVKRTAWDTRSSVSGACVGASRDPEPGLKWAGGYPGARFRPFASNQSRRWFTTGDSVEKVLAYFASTGKKPRTAEELVADASQWLIEEANRITESPDPDDEARLMELMLGAGAQGAQNWSATFSGMEGIGEIKFVMLSRTQAIAVFRDDFLKATSIVAPRPPEALNLTPDMEKLKREAFARSILRY